MTKDITLFGLIIAYSLLLIPLLIFKFLKIKLINDTIIAFLRMSIQLFLVGIYLKYIFELDNMWLNIAWALIMIGVAAGTVIRRTGLKPRIFAVPIFLSIFTSLLLIDIAFLGFMIDIKYKFEARYFIPISGMIIGNLMRADVMAINEFYKKLKQESTLYQFLLANGSTLFEALLPFMRSAIIVAMNPLLASTAVTGLIALPGMMTGQLLGGSMPMTAIKYQIAIIITIFVAQVITIFLSLIFASRASFDSWGNLKNVFAK